MMTTLPCYNSRTHLLHVNTSHGYRLSCPYSSKTESWKNGTDCCEWDGVTCDIHSGHVIGLDLSCSNLQGVIHPNSTIFQLRQLQQLNLAVNDFSRSSIPSGIGDLVSLTHLNLSFSEIGGDIPSSISHLSKLVSLDLSVWGMRLNPYTWKKLILNATNLRELRLDYANMSSIRESSLSLLLNSQEKFQTLLAIWSLSTIYLLGSANFMDQFLHHCGTSLNWHIWTSEATTLTVRSHHWFQTSDISLTVIFTMITLVVTSRMSSAS